MRTRAARPGTDEAGGVGAGGGEGTSRLPALWASEGFGLDPALTVTLPLGFSSPPAVPLLSLW